MDDVIKKIDTAEKCAIFARNARERGREDLAQEALKHAINLKAAKHKAVTDAEKAALQAVYAYEETLRAKRGKNIRAHRTWQMIDRHGIIEAVERAVKRPTETPGYTSLVGMGLQDFAFEAVILRFPDVFSAEALAVSKARLADWA
jgi:hypothetical protein